jgi:hypothetical protein
VLVQGSRQLLSRLLQLLSDCESLERQRVPFVLEGGEEGGNGSERWWAWSHDSGGFEVDEVGDFEFFPIYRVFVILRNIRLD